MEYELIRLDLRLRWLGTPLLTVRDLVLVVSMAPPDSPLTLTIAPDARWSLQAHLLALAVDALSAANWQRSGGKGSRRPEPIPRPGVAPANRQTSGLVMDTDTYRRMLALPRKNS